MIIAHRGASALEAENTLEAFEAAIRAGADGIEFDIRMTADGHAVVMHDAAVDRTTDGRGLVRAMTLSQVKGLRIRTSAGALTTVPTLEETLESVSGRAFVDIEIKNIPGQPDFDADEEPAVEAALAALAGAGLTEDALITSFNPFSLAHVRTIAPSVATGLLTQEEVDADAALTYAHSEGFAWVLPHKVSAMMAGGAYVRQAHGYGMRVGTWLTDDVHEAGEQLAIGVDAVATNDPAALIAGLAAN
jgi:glycerophosphoryl diester phosphodiesterase